MKKFELRQIKAEETYNIRHSILRPHQNFEECKYDTDFIEGSFHIGAYYRGDLVSVASFCLEQCEDFEQKQQYRLRAMATYEKFRSQGAGSSIVNYAEKVLRERNISFLWCKARVSAVAYYTKLGFKKYGEVFDYPFIGEHIIMYKNLKK